MMRSPVSRAAPSCSTITTSTAPTTRCTTTSPPPSTPPATRAPSKAPTPSARSPLRKGISSGRPLGHERLEPGLVVDRYLDVDSLVVFRGARCVARDDVRRLLADRSRDLAAAG